MFINMSARRNLLILCSNHVPSLLGVKCIHSCGRTIILQNIKLYQIHIRNKTTIIKPVILGIESSCDDSGAAIIDGSGQILGEKLYTQTEKSVMFGGVIPIISFKLHGINIQKAVSESLQQANLGYEDITAIAVTVKPGNKGNLRQGCKLAKEICRKYNKPLIPIHHMRAHALTIRMIEQVKFPFLTVLISGGHFTIAVARDIEDWVVIQNEDIEGPGCILDQISRRLKLRNLKEYSKVCGGQAIEMAAKGGDYKKYKYIKTEGLFGIKSYGLSLIRHLEKTTGIQGGNVLPEYKDVCAYVQYCMTKYLIRKTQKAIGAARYVELMPRDGDLHLVLSGGVACNQYIREVFEKMCNLEEYTFHIPPPKLCSDNGVMIAWSGLEQWRANENILRNEEDYMDLRVSTEEPMGKNEVDERIFRNLPKPIYLKF